MKKYTKEAAVLLLQLLMFYLFPVFAGPTDAIGMVVLIILATFVLSLILGAISGNKIKYLYPIITAIVFIPSVLIYYNESALVHSLWYLIISAFGIILGSLIRFIAKYFTTEKGD